MKIIFLSFFLLTLCISAGYTQSKSTGLEFLDDNVYASIPLVRPPLFGSVPNSVDLEDWFPQPGNQGQQSSCVGWAVSYLKSYQENRERGQAKFHFSPSYIYNQIKSGYDCSGGSSFVSALSLVRRDGAAELHDFPYNQYQCSSMPSAGIVSRARQYAIAEWRRVNVQDAIEIKAQIASGFPVLIGMMVDDAFMSLSSGVTYLGSNGQPRGGHAMVVIGYSDQRSAFKVINSWGTSWGDGGYGWISYSAFPKYVREAYTSQDIVISPPLPGPGPQPPSSPSAEPQVSIQAPIIRHNAPIQTSTGATVPGMIISVPGRVTGGGGKFVQLVAKFSFHHGNALRANALETKFRDSGGFVIAATDTTLIGSDSEDLSALAISIPYYALNFTWTGGMTALNLQTIVSVNIENKEIDVSPIVPFLLRW